MLFTRPAAALKMRAHTAWQPRIAAAVAMVLAQASMAAASGTSNAAAGNDALRLAQSASAKVVAFDIKPQPMNEALTAIGAQSGITVIVATKVSQGIQANGLSGRYTVDEALKRLLEPAGLKAEYLDSNTVAVLPAHASDSQTDRGGYESSRIRLARTNGTQGAGAESNRSAAIEADDTGGILQEIVVTSQKRSERLADVPLPVTAVTAATLADRNEYRIQDYYTTIPGLQLSPNQLGGTSTIAIRGVTTGDFGNPTVGVTVDDVPFGSSTVLGGGFFVPDLDPTDLGRIEVLRGPQGTLYGASSLGGLLKYVTVDPSTERTSGRVQVGLGSVAHSSDVGYNVSGALNLPLGDTWAMRVSGFSRDDPGYIDNLNSGESDVNRTRIKGAHLSTLWRPSDEFSLKLSALAQDNRVDGSPYVTIAPGAGDLQQNLLANTGYSNRKFFAYSANASLELGIVNLTSVTGFSRTETDNAYDLTASVGPLTEESFPTGAGARSTIATDVNRTSKFSQELRLSMPLGTRVDWLLGGFYTRERTPWVTEYLATDENGSTIGNFATFDFWSSYSDLAAFTNLTFHVTDRFDVQLGGRESRIHLRFREVDTGPFVSLFESTDGSSVVVYPLGDVTDSSFTYLLTPQFKITPDAMVYARFASGYRPGGINGLGSLAGLPATFAPDKTRNYELGAKATVLDGKLFVDASVYRIDWQEIQLQLLDPETRIQFFANGSAAKSEGVELSVQTASLAGFSIGGWVSWNDARLTEPLGLTSPVIGNRGDRLPFSGRTSANVSIDYEFPVGAFTGSIGGAVSYVDERLGVFIAKDDAGDPVSDRQTFSGYAKTDLRATLSTVDWTLGLYINNVTDKRAILGGGLGTPNGEAFTVIQPRSIGATLARKF